MPTYTAPGVYVETADRAVRGITAIRTDVAGLVGIAARGPLDEPVRVESWEQFRSTFGGLIGAGYLAYAVKAFVENGGRTCHVVRVAVPATATVTVAEPAPFGTSSSPVASTERLVPGAVATLRQEVTASHVIVAVDAATRRIDLLAHVEPEFAMDRPMFVASDAAGARTDAAAMQPGDRTGLILESVAGFAAGDAITVSQPQEQANAVTAIDAAARRVTWLLPLARGLDPAQPIGVETGAGPATALLRDGRSRPVLRVTAASPGTWGNSLTVVVNRSTPAATRTDDRPPPEDGSGLYVSSVVGLGVDSLVSLYQDAPGGDVVTHRYVAAVDPLRRLVTFDRRIDDDLDPALPATLETMEFSVSVLDDGRLVEVAEGLVLHPGHPYGVGSPLAAAALRTVTIEPAVVADFTDPVAAAARFPETGRSTRLSGGRDGLAALTPDDLTGDPGASQRRGIRALETVDEVSFVAIPDVHIRPVPPPERAPRPVPEVDPCCPGDPPPPVPEPPPRFVELPPVFTEDQVAAVQHRLIAHCEEQRDRLAILDPPPGLDEGEIRAWRANFDTTFAALYYPWVRVADPDAPGLAITRAIPPSGHVGGNFARADLTTGVHRAPANLGLRWVQDVVTPVDAAVQGGLNPLGINCIRALPGRGIRVYGARTVSSEPQWRFVPVRRLVMMIAEAIEEAIPWAVFEPNDAALRAAIRISIGSFLRTLWQRGALVGDTADEAFFVRCDEANNPPEVVDAGRLVADVGVAPTRPAEFVVLRVGRTENELEVIE